MGDKICKENKHETLSKPGEGNTEDEAQKAAKAAFEKAFTKEEIDQRKKDAEHDLKCAERKCYDDDDGNPRHCELYYNLSDGHYLKDPEEHNGKVRVSYVVVAFFGCECKQGKAKEK